MNKMWPLYILIFFETFNSGSRNSLWLFWWILDLSVHDICGSLCHDKERQYRKTTTRDSALPFPLPRSFKQSCFPQGLLWVIFSRQFRIRWKIQITTRRRIKVKAELQNPHPGLEILMKRPSVLSYQRLLPVEIAADFSSFRS